MTMTKVREALSAFIEEQMSCANDFRRNINVAMDHICDGETDDALACLEKLHTSLLDHENALSEMAREENW